MSEARVAAVHSGARHEFSKTTRAFIRLVAGLGVEGDAHAGATTQHIYYKRKDPTRPNLRQVHLIHAELFDLLARRGFQLRPGELGENITTCGLDLLELPEAAELEIGPALIRITGLRAPCGQIDRFQPGLRACLVENGRILCGVMGVVLRGGEVRPGDTIGVTLAPGERRPLGTV
jgi:MOSC domain-containing protein YiiM